MKIRLWFLFGCFCLWFFPSMAQTESELDYIERFPTGYINWTLGVVTATGSAFDLDFPLPAGYQVDLIEQAIGDAANNLLQTLKQLRINHHTVLTDRLGSQNYFFSKVAEMASAARIAYATTWPNGDFSVTLEMDLYGGFAQLMLPSEIQQVEYIKPLNFYHSDNNRPMTPLKLFSGLLVDARDIGATPSMVPVLMDENGQEVYSPAFVSREYAVLNGMCRYIKGVGNSSQLPLIGPNPLQVKGLRTVCEKSCDIIISNTDASRIRSASSHLEFLKKCRVIIILD